MPNMLHDAVGAASCAGVPVKSDFIHTPDRGGPASRFERRPRLDFEYANRII